MWFKVRLVEASAENPKTANLYFGGRLVASAPFTFWGGVGEITTHAEADLLAPEVKKRIPAFLTEWGKSAVAARLNYANDKAELDKEI